MDTNDDLDDVLDVLDDLPPEDFEEVPQHEEVEEAAQPEATPQPEAVPQPSQDLSYAELLRQNQELLAQQFAAANANNSRIEELERRLADYEKKPQTQEEEWYAKLGLNDLTEQQRATFANSIPVIEQIAARRAVEAIQAYENARLNPRLEQLNQTVQPLATDVNTTRENLRLAQEQAFRAQVSARLPWLDEARGTAEYANYYNSVIPNTGGIKRSVLLEQAYNAGDANAVVELLSGFKSNSQPANTTHIAPGRTNTTVPSGNNETRTRKGMRLSTYLDAVEKHSNGKMSTSEFDKYETAWHNALLNGTAVDD